MRRYLAVLGVAAIAATGAGAYEAFARDAPRGAVAGTISTGALCRLQTARAEKACARWLRGTPTLEFSPVDRVVREYRSAVPDSHGRFRLALAPGDYVAWWASTTRGGSLTNRFMHHWHVEAGRTTPIGTVTPIVLHELGSP
jgi:hypothetical protein